MAESTEFDASLGGSEHLPYSANCFKFAASRSIEIAAMTESILRPSKTKLVFQTLPVHMRRRVMSHNTKRLPRKLRQAHLEQLKKSGLPPKQKRPSRKYRRRPANLLDEYNRRQKRNVWLETHIWHAKRFHMTNRWGCRLAYAPCDKAFRACYRASAAHCLLQDVSYMVPIQIKGTIETIKNLFKTVTNQSCGLSLCAKAYISEKREGSIDLFEPDRFPFSYIGKVQFIWVSGTGQSKYLWLFVHPSQIKQIESLLLQLVQNGNDCNIDTPQKRRKIYDIQIKTLTGCYNRFRLTGPKSHSVLVNSLKSIEDGENIATNEWFALHDTTNLYLKEKNEYWLNISLANSPSQLPPRTVIGLVIRDPRLSRPTYRTKATNNHNNDLMKTEHLINIPPYAPTSPLWDLSIHDTLKKKCLTNGQFIEHITKTQLIPGEINENNPVLQSVPIVLIRRPGSQDSTYKRIGYGCGWDIIVPSGYGMPFWLTFVMFGARSGGLRETESLAFEMGECMFPPDCNAGKEEEKRLEIELKDKYYKLPPSKRINYIKLGINSPFVCPWKLLLKDWSDNETIDDFFILRNRKNLEDIQECLNKKKILVQIPDASQCLVPVYVKLQGRGKLKRHALVCLPEPGDLYNMNTLFEPHHQDPNEKIRKQKRKEHIKHIKCLRRKRNKLKKQGTANTDKSLRKIKHEPSEYVKAMQELWLPSKLSNVRHYGSRQVIGYLSQGAFSFSEACSSGVGYLAYKALNTLLCTKQNKVLIRNTSSRRYRLADITIIKNS